MLHQLMVQPCDLCRYAGVVPKCPRSINPGAFLRGGGKAESLFLFFNNVGPQTAETEACFQMLYDYAAPR